LNAAGEPGGSGNLARKIGSPGVAKNAGRARSGIDSAIAAIKNYSSLAKIYCRIHGVNIRSVT
jgi:hypothetical protein